MRALFQPEVKVIMGEFVERATHNFEGRDLLQRFKEFNSQRDEGGAGGADRDRASSPTPASASNSSSSSSSSARPGKKGQANKSAKTRAFRREYKFPAGINEDPMAFLNDNLDDSILAADQVSEGGRYIL